MTTKSKKNVVRGLLPMKVAKFKGIRRDEQLPTGLTVRKLFHRKRYQGLLGKYVAFEIDGRWVIPLEIKLGLI